MALPKQATNRNKITVFLSDEEQELLEAFAAEQGIETLEQAIPAMIRELVRLHDQLWDAEFAQSAEQFNKMAREAQEEERAGLTEDLDI
ncbi:MAG: hypothetical protein ABI690_19695 [Chloroflexota bacterium]